MAGMIPRSFIDDLLTRVDIVDVINARVPLKQKGREYTACCPFHSEKTPSFTVSQVKQFYHCFGCGVHGTAISFLMEYEHMDFVEAIETLARSQGLEVPKEKSRQNPQEQKKKLTLYDLLQDVASYYQQQLKQFPLAQEYLANRGLSSDIIERFGVGFIPDGWDNVLKHFSPRYQPQQLNEAGLLIEKDQGGFYDRFRDRVMFPIRDKRGRVVGFGGRVLGDGTPKYLNSPETPVFHKGTELYGFYEARQHTRKLERVLVVEGYMDVIALAQFDISYAVATLGTATTQEHVKQLFRAVHEVIFCFDGDRAGRDAAWRALQNVLPVLQSGKEIRFMFLPMGEDPDTQVRKIGKEAFEALLDGDSVSLTDYLLDHLSGQYNVSSREGKARFLGEVGKLLLEMPDGLIKDQLITDIARLTSVEVSLLKERNIGAAVTTEPKQNFNRLSDREVRFTPVRFAITLLLHKPALAFEVENPEQISLFDLPGASFLATLIETIEENPHINAAALLDRWRNTEYESSLISLMKWQPESQNDEMLTKEFRDCLRQIRKKAHEQKLENLLHKERTQGLDEVEKKDLIALLSGLNISGEA